jgi:hypothetical protein
MWWNKASWVMIIAEAGHIASIDRCRHATDDELAEQGLQRIPKKPKLTVAMHRIVTLSNGTEFDLEKITMIHPLYRETEEGRVEREKLGWIPSSDNTYVVEMEGSENSRWDNARIPRDELVKLWEGETGNAK